MRKAGLLALGLFAGCTAPEVLEFKGPDEPAPPRPTISPVKLDLELSTELADFGGVVLGHARAVTIRLNNPNDEPVDVDLTFDGATTFCGIADAASKPFCIRGLAPRAIVDRRFGIPAGVHHAFEVVFTPQVTGVREASQITFRACPTCTQEILQLRGSGVDRALRCDPAEIGFGSVNPGACLALPIECRNVTGNPLSIRSWGPSPGFPFNPLFELTPTLEGAVVSPGRATGFTLQFCPIDETNQEAAFIIETDHPLVARGTSSLRASGRGGGPNIDVSPRSLDFGVVAAGTNPSIREIEITNVGNDLLVVEGFSFQGDAGFTLSQNVGAQLAPGESRSVEIRFLPLAPGAFSTELIVRSSDRDSPATGVALTGRSLDVGPCAYSITPRVMDMAEVVTDHTTQHPISVTNIGTSPCILQSVHTTGGFEVIGEDLLRPIIEPGRTISFDVAITPTCNSPCRSSSDWDQDVTGSVELELSSPTDPLASIPIQAAVRGWLPTFAESVVELGASPAGCTSQREVELFFRSQATFDSFRIVAPSGHPFEATPQFSLPFTGDRLAFDIQLTREATELVHGALFVEATLNGPATRRRISLVARPERQRRESFVQLPGGKVDFLFLINNRSNSQATSSDGVRAILSRASSLGLDWRAAFVGDQRPTGRLWDSTFFDEGSNPSWQEAITNTFARHQFFISTDGLGQTHLTMIEPGISVLRRTDAYLSIIHFNSFMSSSSLSADRAIAGMLSLVSNRNRNRISLSAVGGNDLAVVDTVRRTGGDEVALLRPPASALDRLSDVGLGLRRAFFLDQPAEDSSIVVSLDNTEVPRQTSVGVEIWQFDPQLNAIVFAPAATPEIDAQIDVDYLVACDR